MSSAAEAPVDISVVIPCYNEQENAEPIARAVITQLEGLGISFDLLFIDNASTDRTVPIIRAMCAADPRIRLIVNSRNFGQLRSPTYGIYQTRGAAVIGMCADFQDPPDLIPELIARWRGGADVVLGVRASEGGSLVLRAFRTLGYKVLSRIADHRIVRNATGFGLFSRRVVDLLAELNEPEPFFRAMLLESGLPLELVYYPRPQRRAGYSKNDFFALVDFSLSALSSSSKRSLRGPFFVAFLLSGLSCLAAVGAFALWLAGIPHAATLGWAAFFELHFGLLFLFLGLNSDQVRLISERTRRTPLVVEREQVNILPPSDRWREDA